MTQRTEVFTLMLHFLITLSILGAYIFTVWKGAGDETLKNLLLLTGGYWFGVIGGNKVKEALRKKGDDANE